MIIRQYLLPENQHKVGHWRRKGYAMTLCELFEKFGNDHTAYDLMFWYTNSDKMVKKREHSWGRPECKEAARARHKEFGHRGHRDRPHKALALTLRRPLATFRNTLSL